MYKSFVLSPEIHAALSAPINRALTAHTQLIQMILEKSQSEKAAIYDFCRRELFTRLSRKVGDPIDVWRLGEAFVVLVYGLFVCSVVLVMESSLNFLRKLRNYSCLLRLYSRVWPWWFMTHNGFITVGYIDSSSWYLVLSSLYFFKVKCVSMLVAPVILANRLVSVEWQLHFSFNKHGYDLHLPMYTRARVVSLCLYLSKRKSITVRTYLWTLLPSWPIMRHYWRLTHFYPHQTKFFRVNVNFGQSLCDSILAMA